MIYPNAETIKQYEDEQGDEVMDIANEGSYEVPLAEQMEREARRNEGNGRP